MGEGLLNILQYEWLDFVVRSGHHGNLHVERIKRDCQLWEKIMLPKLLAFYNKCVLPELAVGRHNQSPGIHVPKEPWEIIF